ncbi:MAG: FISUMP domain-containing protein [Patescibacteria group bacterium]
MSLFSGQKINNSRVSREKKIITALALGGIFCFLIAPKSALALHTLSTYTKSYNGTLTAGEWNNLLYDNDGRAGYGDFVPTWLAAYMTGPLGIGTTTPISGLAVSGPITATNFTGIFSSSIVAGNVTSGELGSNYSGGNFTVGVNNLGNFGIGVALPDERLEILGNILATLDSGGAATFVENPDGATSTGKIQLGRTASDGYESISFDPLLGTNGRFVFTAPLQVPASSPGITFFDPSDPTNTNKQRSIEYSASTLQLQAGDAFKVNFSTNTGQPPSSKTFFQIGPNDLSNQAAQGIFLGANTPAAFQGDLIHFQVGSSTRFRVTKWGDIVSGGSVMTMNGPILNTTQTWNNSGVNFTAWIMNITDTASVSTSKLLDLRVGDVSKFIIDKFGSTGINKGVASTTLDVVGSGNFTGTVNGTGLCIGGECKISWPEIGAASSGWTRTAPYLYTTSLSDNVGIGTSTPLFKLDVAGIINATALYVNGTPYIGSQWTTNGSDIYYNTGKVGIGVTGPLVKLDVNGNGWIGHATTTNTLSLGQTDFGGYTNQYLGQIVARQSSIGNGGGSLDFNVFYAGTPYWSGITAMTITNKGNVGIGKTNPGAALDVIGAINSNSTVNGTGLCIAGDCKTSWPSIVEAGGGGVWTRVGAYVYTSTSTDSVGIGTGTPQAKLDVVGDLKIGDTATACDSTKAGAFRYNSTSRQTYLCDGTRWLNMRNCGTMVDDEGHTYGTVVIGGQCWMAENINIGTMLASGATEPTTTDNVIQKWCYNNLSANCMSYGGLYNWNEAMRGSKTAGARGICPNGWHIPTDREYNDLEKTVIGIIASPNTQYVCDFNTIISENWYWRRCADNNGTDGGGTYGAGRSLKAIGQGTGNGAGDDLVGFNGKFGGARDTNGSFQVLDSYLYLWTSSVTDNYSWYRVLYSSYSTIERNLDLQTYGFSVRCLKD